VLEEVRREVDPQLRQVLAKLQVRLGAANVRNVFELWVLLCTFVCELWMMKSGKGGATASLLFPAYS
jgi:hypothetical protein